MVVYLRTNAEQLALLESFGIATIRQLFDAANAAAWKHPSAVVSRRHLLRFLNKRCARARLNVRALIEDKVVAPMGVFPDQLLELKKADALLLAHPLNDGLDEEAAFCRALEESAKHVPVERISDIECPITLEVFRDPVIIATGRVFERSAIEEWIARSKTDPLTGEALSSLIITPDFGMRVRASAYAMANYHA